MGTLIYSVDSYNTDAALLELMDLIQKSLKDKEIAACAFIKIARVFHNYVNIVHNSVNP